MKSLRAQANQMKPIPEDVLALLSAEQKVKILKGRYDVCFDFQAELEMFWRTHYNAAVMRLTMGKDPVIAVIIGEAYKALCRADFNVSHEGCRELDHLKRFLKGVERKEMPTEESVKHAMWSGSWMPNAFMSAYNLYTGGTEIDVKLFFPTLNFDQCSASAAQPEEPQDGAEGKS